MKSMNVSRPSIITIILLLKASDGQIIGNSGLYASKAGMENGIETVRKYGTDTKVIEEAPPLICKTRL